MCELCSVRNVELLHPTYPTTPTTIFQVSSPTGAEQKTRTPYRQREPKAQLHPARVLHLIDADKQFDQAEEMFPTSLRHSLGRPFDQTKQIAVPDKPAKFGPFLGLKVDELSNPPSRRHSGRTGRRGGGGGGGGAADGGGRWNLSPVRPRLAVCLEFRLSALRVIIPGRDSYERDLLRHLGEDIPDQVWLGFFGLNCVFSRRYTASSWAVCCAC